MAQVTTPGIDIGQLSLQDILRRERTLEPNSIRSHDITAKDGTPVHVKAITQTGAKARGQFSTFRSLKFHTAIFLIFDADELYLAGAYEMSPEEIELHASFSKQVNGYNIRLRKVIDAGHTCLTEMQEAFVRL